ncbi:Methyltransferase domain-containing protein [Friedmanniella luteola]|uniref:Methyltransferase domain-containing protein n=1 Tax=Friedmanniella luteola TaxID=546871 RepID=A0A1H1YV30_9ACTN|nr:class I SAM-dependent methyltransferase [Friedmanniella luteola]SDT25169.1 Methyltransferase domain-containing protein [Friedmanniella luteola]
MTAPALPPGLTAEALADAVAEPDPDGLAAATRLRAAHGSAVGAAALHQASLRRRARQKFGDRAATLFFTRDGLEQATRPAVAAHHAARLVAAGAARVVDLGCGIGTDALAFADAGLEVVAVERDPGTAAVAAANLGERGQVLCADAEAVAAELLTPGTAAFCDPARRSGSGRLWRVTDFTPSWDLVTTLLAGDRVAGVKLGPALPHTLVPTTAEAEWVTHDGDTVEVGLWAGPGARPDLDVATLLPGARLEVPRPGPGRPAEPLPVGPVGRYLFEPDGAVIRARGVGPLGRRLGAHLLNPEIAYLSGDTAEETPFATAFEVLDVLGAGEKTLRRWVREHEVGTLEIKKRGVDVDPAVLRRRLAPRGPGRATLVLSRTPSGAVALVVRRLGHG